MNGFPDHGLDQAAFGEKGGFTQGLRTFDAFREFDAYSNLTPSQVSSKVYISVDISVEKIGLEIPAVQLQKQLDAFENTSANSLL